MNTHLNQIEIMLKSKSCVIQYDSFKTTQITKQAGLKLELNFTNESCMIKHTMRF